VKITEAGTDAAILRWQFEKCDNNVARYIRRRLDSAHATAARNRHTAQYAKAPLARHFTRTEPQELQICFSRAFFSVWKRRGSAAGFGGRRMRHVLWEPRVCQQAGARNAPQAKRSVYKSVDLSAPAWRELRAVGVARGIMSRMGKKSLERRAYDAVFHPVPPQPWCVGRRCCAVRVCAAAKAHAPQCPGAQERHERRIVKRK